MDGEICGVGNEDLPVQRLHNYVEGFKQQCIREYGLAFNRHISYWVRISELIVLPSGAADTGVLNF